MLLIFIVFKKKDEQKRIQVLCKERVTETERLQGEALKDAVEKELDNYLKEKGE